MAKAEKLSQRTTFRESERYKMLSKELASILGLSLSSLPRWAEHRMIDALVNDDGYFDVDKIKDTVINSGIKTRGQPEGISFDLFGGKHTDERNISYRQRSGELNTNIMDRIGSLYHDLESACWKAEREYSCFNTSDIFQDTIIEVARENLPAMTDRELIEHFRYKFGRVQYQNIKDLNEANHAIHRKTSEEEDNLLF
jgi:hypothetical protein